MEKNIRSIIQQEALEAHKKYGLQSTIALSVGLGKGKIAVDRVLEIQKKIKSPKILFTGARNVYNDSFKKELEKWNCDVKNITFICNKSLKNFYNDKWDLIIIDEIHKESDIINKFLRQSLKINLKCEILGLTGTPDKFNSIHEVLPISYSYSLEDAITSGILNDFEINIIRYNLNPTEKSLYSYYFKNYMESPIGVSYSPELNRLKLFLNNLKSKSSIVELIINKFLKEEKVLIFAGSIEQSNEFKYYQKYNSSIKNNINKENYNNFFESKNNILVNVGILKESVSIPKLKNVFIMGIDSSPTSKIQTLGRLVRLTLEEKGKAFFIVAKDTIEEKWVMNGLEKFKEKIKIVNYE